MARNLERPTRFVISGPNGAGKSTLATTLLLRLGSIPFVNADVTTKRLSPDDPDAAILEAGRLTWPNPTTVSGDANRSF